MGGKNVLQRISIKGLRRFCNRLFHLNRSAKSLTDQRKKYEIPLSIIFLSLLYTSILSKKSFLSRDLFLRKKYALHFLKSGRKMVASDSTLIRNLSNNIQSDELAKINFEIANRVVA